MDKLVENQKRRKVDLEETINKTIGIVKSIRQDIERLLQLSEEEKLS